MSGLQVESPLGGKSFNPEEEITSFEARLDEFETELLDRDQVCFTHIYIFIERERKEEKDRAGCCMHVTDN